MNPELPEAVLSQLRQILNQDAQSAIPAVQSISLSFWQSVQRWVRHIANTPEPFTIALTGASGSGKSFIREVIVEKLSEVSEVSSFTQDNYYRDFAADFPKMPLETFYDEINLDDPAHLQFDRMLSDLQRLKGACYGQLISIDTLQYGTPTSKPTLIPNGLSVEVSPFIVTEGIHAFYDSRLLPLYDLKIFVDIDEATRRERWLARNRMENRGTTDNMWNTTVACLEQFTLPTRSVADLVLNNNANQDQMVQLVEDIVSLLSSTAELYRVAA
jgi:uridine kinase